jgi:transcriptional regulator with XRE-family HTH domain
MTQQVKLRRGVPPLTLGWRLQMALDYGDIKQSDLMDRFEVSRQTVSRWCNDVGVPPKKFILEAIAEMCHVQKEWLTEEAPDMSPVAEQTPAAPAVLKSRKRPGPRTRKNFPDHSSVGYQEEAA